MIINPNTEPTELFYNSDSNYITIEQRKMGARNKTSVALNLDDLKEFIKRIEG